MLLAFLVKLTTTCFSLSERKDNNGDVGNQIHSGLAQVLRGGDTIQKVLAGDPFLVAPTWLAPQYHVVS